MKNLEPLAELAIAIAIPFLFIAFGVMLGAVMFT
jgi:hypothetical protein